MTLWRALWERLYRKLYGSDSTKSSEAATCERATKKGVACGRAAAQRALRRRSHLMRSSARAREWWTCSCHWTPLAGDHRRIQERN